MIQFAVLFVLCEFVRSIISYSLIYFLINLYNFLPNLFFIQLISYLLFLCFYCCYSGIKFNQVKVDPSPIYLFLVGSVLYGHVYVTFLHIFYVTYICYILYVTFQHNALTRLESKNSYQYGWPGFNLRPTGCEMHLFVTVLIYNFLIKVMR